MYINLVIFICFQVCRYLFPLFCSILIRDPCLVISCHIVFVKDPEKTPDMIDSSAPSPASPKPIYINLIVYKSTNLSLYEAAERNGVDACI